MLHSVPAPKQEQQKRTFPELVAAIYEDARVGHETRELLLAVAYAVDLAKREDGVSPLKVARRKLGVDNIGRARYDRLMAFGWKVLIPVALANIMVTAVLKVVF